MRSSCATEKNNNDGKRSSYNATETTRLKMHSLAFVVIGAILGMVTQVVGAPTLPVTKVIVTLEVPKDRKQAALFDIGFLSMLSIASYFRRKPRKRNKPATICSDRPGHPIRHYGYSSFKLRSDQRAG